jgi:hypothetical protein
VGPICRRQSPSPAPPLPLGLVGPPRQRSEPPPRTCSLMFSVMLIFPMQYLCVLLRVDDQVTEEPGAQQVEDPEQELTEGRLCP